MSKQTKFPKQNILGVEVDCLNSEQAIAEITTLAKQPKAHYIVKPYVEHLDLAARDPRFRNLLNGAYLSLPDGVSLNWASYFNSRTQRHLWQVLTSGLAIVFRPGRLHTQLPNYSWSSGFSWKLLKEAAARGLSVYLVGAPKNSTIVSAQKFLQTRIANLKISGVLEGRDSLSGYFNERLEQQLADELKRLKPDLVLLGLGIPRQEKIAARMAAQLAHGVLIGEGGTFDYQTFGGKLAQAPAWMQHRGLEWLWRLGREPWRVRRQLAIPRFVWKVYRAAQRQ